MNAPTQTAADALERRGEPFETVPESAWANFSALTKARLSLMVVFTTSIGYCMGAVRPFEGCGLLIAVIGTSLSAGAAAVFNQVLEVDADSRMERTRNRPLPARRVTRGTAVSLGLFLGFAGVLTLWFGSTPRAAFLSALTILIYLFAYTPLKRISAWCTWVGAVSGAIPPVIGWAATESTDNQIALILFGILFFWQIPHFLAIAWIYRQDYESAGLVMIKKDDFTGIFTAIQTVLFSLLLCLLAAIPFYFGEMRSFYGIGAVVVNLFILGSSIVFLLERSRVSARRLFFASILYLPAMLFLFAFGFRSMRSF